VVKLAASAPCSTDADPATRCFGTLVAVGSEVICTSKALRIRTPLLATLVWSPPSNSLPKVVQGLAGDLANSNSRPGAKRGGSREVPFKEIAVRAGQLR
jgi:hypothetical protein